MRILSIQIKHLNSNLGGLSFYEDESGDKYVVGADSVPKKLGEQEILIEYFNSYNATITGTVATHTFDISKKGYNPVAAGITYCQVYTVGGCNTGTTLTLSESTINVTINNGQNASSNNCQIVVIYIPC